MMKKIITVLTILCISLSAQAAQLPTPKSSGKPIDQIAAIANDQIITQSQVSTLYRQTVQQIKSHHVRMPDESLLKQQILNRLIDQSLQLQLAKRANLSVTESQINLAIKNIAEQHRLSVSGLKQKIKKDGYTYPAFREQIKKQILISMLQHQALSGKIKVTNAEIKQLRNQYQSQGDYGNQYHLIDILIALPTAPTKTQVKQAKVEALQILKSLKAGANVYHIKGAEVNDLGWRTMQDLPDLFTHQLKKMSPGNIVGPLRAGNGYHILKLIKIKKAKKQLPTNAEMKRILEAHKFQKALVDWITKLRKKAYVKILTNGQ